jgi:hypothetical protein
MNRVNETVRSIKPLTQSGSSLRAHLDLFDRRRKPGTAEDLAVRYGPLTGTTRPRLQEKNYYFGGDYGVWRKGSRPIRRRSLRWSGICCPGAPLTFWPGTAGPSCCGRYGVDDPEMSPAWLQKIRSDR